MLNQNICKTSVLKIFFPYVKTSDYLYSRFGNLSRDAVEAVISRLEGGTHGFVFSSGMYA